MASARRNGREAIAKSTGKQLALADAVAERAATLGAREDARLSTGYGARLQ